MRHRFSAILPIIVLFLTVCLHAQETPARGELTARLAEQVATALKSGEKLRAWANVLGKKTEQDVSAADAKALTVLVQGNPFPVNWDKMSPEDLLAVAKSFTAGKGERFLLAAEMALALGFSEQAGELVTQAMQADPSLVEKAKALAARLPDAPAIKPVAPPARNNETEPDKPSTSANSGMTPGTVPRRAGQARTERPRLLFDAARLAAARMRAQNADGKRFLSYLKGAKDVDARNFPLAYVLSGDAAFAKQAVDIGQKSVGGAPVSNVGDLEEIANVALTYDWCYGQLTADQRKAWQAWILKSYDNMKDAYLVGYHNYAIKAAWAFALAGYALQGDHPRAAELLENAYGKRWRTLIQPACKAGLAGGAWAEGEGYGSTTCFALLELIEAARCAEGKDLAAEVPEFLLGRLAFLLFLDEPGVVNGGRRLWLNGDMNRTRNWDGALEQRLMLQDMLRGTELAAFAQAYAELPAANSRQFNSCNWLDVMWRDRTLPQRPLEAFKLSHHAWGRGTVLMRSDWTENATHVGFVAGPLISASHAHADAGHFSIWKGGELATMAGDYRGTSGPWALDAYKRTVAHNTLLIYDPSEKFTVRHSPAGNDGGQLWIDSENNLEGAKIIAYDARRAYTYVCADLSPAYSKSKAALVRRQLLYLRPDTVVIVDSVVAKNEGFPKTWQCYLDGQASATDKTFTTSNGKAKLRGEALLPLDSKVTLLGGQDKGLKVGNTVVRQPAGGNGADDGPAWRAEVRPGAPRAADVFAVVLRVFDNAEPAAASLKDRGGRVAISIPGAGEVVLSTDGNPGGSVNGRALAQSVVLQEE